MAVIADVRLDEMIDLGGRDPGLEKGPQLIEKLGVELSGHAHPLAFGLVQEQAAAAVVVEHLMDGANDAAEQTTQFSKGERGVAGLAQ